MAKPNWSRTLSEVLKHKTQQITMKSEKTGNDYIVDVVPVLDVVSIAASEEKDNKYIYSVVDINNDLEYSIKAPNKVEVKFGTILRFKNIRGGATNNGVGWYAADSVMVVERNG